VACCNDSIVSCVIPNPYPDDDFINAIQRDCIMAHEDVHIPQQEDCDGCGPYIPDLADPASKNESECEAYVVEIACYEERKPDCVDAPVGGCIDDLDFFITTAKVDSSINYDCIY
jgi:hypothetical protein